MNDKIKVYLITGVAGFIGVKSILKEETYIGHSIHNKQSNISFKNKKKVRKPQEEWYRVENTARWTSKASAVT